MDLANATHGRIRVRIRELLRRAVRFFGGLSNRDLENDFVYRQVVGESVRVLDVGGSESLLPLLFARRGFSVTVYDFRKYPEQHVHLRSIQGDFLNNALPSESFDYVVMLSTIEHIGFGSYAAPLHTDGDLRAIAEAKRVVKPNGSIILTFPFASKETIVPGFERWYDLKRVQRLFEGMYVLAEEYYVPDGTFLGHVVKWTPASEQEITKVDDVLEKYGCQCNACYRVSLMPRVNFH